MEDKKIVRLGKEIFVSWDTFNLLSFFLYDEGFFDFDSIIKYLLIRYNKSKDLERDKQKTKC